MMTLLLLQFAKVPPQGADLITYHYKHQVATIVDGNITLIA